MQNPYGYGAPPPGYGQPQPQPQPAYGNPFDGLPGAKPGTDRRPAPIDGWYLLEVEKCLYFLTDAMSKMQGAPAFVVEFKVLQSLTPNGSAPGFPCGWFCAMQPRRKEQADRELQGFTLAVLGAKIEECGAQLPGLTLAGSDARNAFMGLQIAAQVTSEVNRKGDLDPATGRPKVYSRWKFYPSEKQPGQPRGLDIVMQRVQASPAPQAFPPKAPQAPPQPAYGQAQVGQGQQWQPPPAQQWGAPPGPQYVQPTPQAPMAGPPQGYGGPPAGPPPWQAPPPPAPPAPANPFGGAPMPPPPGYRWDAASGRYIQG